MKLIRFLLLLLRKGTLALEPHDFSKDRKAILATVRYKVTKTSREKKSLPRSRVIYSLRANLGYLFHARTLCTQLFISDSRQLVYVRILKCASTSFLKEFLPSLDPALEGQPLSDEQVDALAFHYLKKKLSERESTYTKLALVRNPFHRLVSVYLDLFDPRATHFSYEAYWFGILRKEMTFGDFVKTIAAVPEYLRGPHFASQHYIISTAAGRDVTWYRIDKDTQQLDDFLRKFSIALPHRNRREVSYDYRTYYTPEILAQAWPLCCSDVHHFGYHEEYAALQRIL